MQRLIVSCLGALALSGCASIFSGTTQDVAIRSTPGAKFVVSNNSGNQVASGEVGEDAIARMNLVRGAGYFSPQSYKVKLSKAGYRPATVDIDPGMNGWYFANIVLGGVIGMVIVDPLTGAMYRLVPRADEALLEPAGQEEAAQAAVPETLVANSRNTQISRNDYNARAALKGTNCAPQGNPEVFNRNSYEEKLVFACKDGRQQAIICRSDTGCSAR